MQDSNPSDDIHEFFRANPEFEKIMELFAETLSTYEETLKAMGAYPQYRIEVGNTSSQQIVITDTSTAHGTLEVSRSH